MITRIFVIARERGPILLGNAACQWLGLIAVLIKNKAPVVGRFMAAVTREETECGEVEAYPLPKTGDGAEMTKPTSKPRLAIEAPKKKRKLTKKANSVANASEPLDVTLESTPSESQPSAPERTEPDSPQEQNTVLSGSTPLNSEQDTAVDFISDAPSERAVTFNDNPVAGTRYIPLRL